MTFEIKNQNIVNEASILQQIQGGNNEIEQDLDIWCKALRVKQITQYLI